MTILIVDDSPNDRYLLRRVLEAEQHTVLEAGDGVEALALLEREQVDIIISDILMPRMDGYRFCHEVRSSERLGHLPIILRSSSYTSAGDEKLSADLGADKFLSKDAPASEIITALNEVTRARRARPAPLEPSVELDLMKGYNQQLVAKLEQKNTDLTLRLEELLSSQQQLLFKSTALDTAANGVVITDVRGIIVWVNPAFSDLTGYRADEVIGETPRLLKSGRHNRAFYKDLWETILSGHTWHGSFTNLRKDGSLYQSEHTITPVRSKEGVITHFIAIMNDVTARKQAEEALAESERKFRVLFDVAHDAIFIVHQGLFVDCNARGLELFGLTREQIIGQPVYLGSPPTQSDGSDAKEKARDLLQGVEAGVPQSFEWLLTRPDGTRVHADISLSRFELGGKVYVQAIARDITERKRAEEVLRDVSARKSGRHQTTIFQDLAVICLLSAIVYSIGRLYDVFDPIFNYFAYQNHQLNSDLNEVVATLVFFGLAMLVFSYRRWRESRAETISQTQISQAMGILHREMEEQVWQRTAAMVKANEALRIEVVERQRAEVAAMRLAAIVEFSDDAIIGKDLNGIVTSWNAGAEKVFGYSTAEMVGVSITRLIPPERQAEEEGILQRIRRGESVEHFETVRMKKDGHRMDISVTVSPIKDAAGNVVGASKVARDITERKQAETSLKLFRTLIDHSNDAIEVVDPATGRFLDVNDKACRRLGYSREELLTMGVPDIETNGKVTRDSWPSVVDEIRQAGSKILEGTQRRKDGSTFPVEINVQYIRLDRDYLLAMVRDVTERKLAEEQIRSKTAILEAQLHSTIDGILIVDNDGNKILQNQRMVELWNIPREFAEDVDDRRQFEWVAGQNKDPRKFKERVAWLHAHPEEIGRDELELADGRIFDRYSAPVRHQDGKYYGRIWGMRDITERQKAEEARRASEGRYRALFEYAPDGIVIANQLGIYLDANASLCGMLGYPREELVGRSAVDIVVPSEIPHIDEAITEIKTKSDYHREWQFRRKDGSVFPAEVIATLMPDGNLLALFRDITERKKAEEQIAEQAAFLDKARDAILVRDLEGKILFWNQGAERMYGWARQEVVGRNIGELLYADPKKFEEVNGLTISQGEWHGELQHLTKERRELTIEARWTLIRDNEGCPKSVLAINTDITDKKKIEAQFMRAQRMESIGTLAGGVAHDLNNILAPIMMSIDILKETAENPQAKEILRTIETSAKRGADIVRQVLSFARGLEGQRIEVQPKHLLKDLEHIIKNTFPKNIQMELTTPRDAWTILGDPTQLHQILLNLCVNARDAMPNGGRLSVSTENRTLDQQYAAMNLQAKPGPYVVISVTDSGTGMPPGIIDKIFDPFFTTKEVGKGTGLGLSTVMAIVKSHEGFINVYSEPGQGTTFGVYLPAAVSSGAGVRAAEVVSLPRGNGETVLVVDDEASILTITSQTLQAFGYKVVTAGDGAEALATYVRNEKAIAVVLTDMAMPVMDGPATIHALLRINPKVKIIAASGLNANGGVARASGAGVKHFLSKPYTAGTLLKTLQAVLQEP